MNNSIYQEVVNKFYYKGDLESLDGLSVRTFNALKRAGIDSISEIKEMTNAELQKIRNLGKKGIAEITAIITDAQPDRRRTTWLELDVDDIEPLALGMMKAGEKDISAYIRLLIKEGLVDE